MCKSHSKMFLYFKATNLKKNKKNLKIGQEMTENLNFENALAYTEIENEHLSLPSQGFRRS